MAKFKVLMFGRDYVDRVQLNHGIYSTKTPDLLHSDSTIEKLVQEAEQVQKDLKVDLADYIENLKKCILADCDVCLSIDSSAPALDAGFFEDVRKLVDYDWNSEEADFEQQDDREVAEITHIYPVLKRLDERLKRIGK